MNFRKVKKGKYDNNHMIAAVTEFNPSAFKIGYPLYRFEIFVPHTQEPDKTEYDLGFDKKINEIIVDWIRTSLIFSKKMKEKCSETVGVSDIEWANKLMKSLESKQLQTIVSKTEIMLQNELIKILHKEKSIKEEWLISFVSDDTMLPPEFIKKQLNVLKNRGSIDCGKDEKIKLSDIGRKDFQAILR